MNVEATRFRNSWGDPKQRESALHLIEQLRNGSGISDIEYELRQFAAMSRKFARGETFSEEEQTQFQKTDRWLDTFGPYRTHILMTFHRAERRREFTT